MKLMSYLCLSPSLWPIYLFLPFIFQGSTNTPGLTPPSVSFTCFIFSWHSRNSKHGILICCVSVQLWLLLNCLGCVFLLGHKTCFVSDWTPQTGAAVLFSALEWALSGGTGASRQRGRQVEEKLAYCPHNWAPTRTITPKWAHPQQLKLYITWPISKHMLCINVYVKKQRKECRKQLWMNYCPFLWRKLVLWTVEWCKLSI